MISGAHLNGMYERIVLANFALRAEAAAGWMRRLCQGQEDEVREHSWLLLCHYQTIQGLFVIHAYVAVDAVSRYS